MENKDKILNATEVIEETKQNKDSEITKKDNKIAELELQLLQNKKKINDIKLRKLAKIENIKKNKEQEIKKIECYKLNKFFKKIIPVINILEEIIEISDKLNIKNTPLIQGIELTLQSLFKILYDFGVKSEGQENEIFNPNLHDCITIQSPKKTSPNHIISIIKKGLIFKQEVLRKAIVTIPQN